MKFHVNALQKYLHPSIFHTAYLMEILFGIKKMNIEEILYEKIHFKCWYTVLKYKVYVNLSHCIFNLKKKTLPTQH